MSEFNPEFKGVVFPDELAEINDRRERLGLEQLDTQNGPSSNHELVGLSLSGGGIRSATFSLGIIQGLAKHGILKHIDYLSTVSGGGFIGGCLSSLLNDKENTSEDENFPLSYNRGASEMPAMTHLRNSSNYLSPGGVFEKLRIPIVLLRGILLNLFVFLPYVMALVFVTELGFEKIPNWNSLPLFILPLVLVFVILAVAFPISIKLFRQLFDWKSRNLFELLLTIPLLAAGILLLLIPLLQVVKFGIDHKFAQIVMLISNLGSFYWWIIALTLMAVLVLFMLVGKASENISKLRSKIVLLLVTLIGPFILFSIYFLLCLWQIDSPFIPIDSMRVLNQAVAFEEKNTRTPWLIKTADSELNTLSPVTIADHFEKAFGSTEKPITAGEFITEISGRSISFIPDAIAFCSSDKIEVPCPDVDDYVYIETETQPVWVIVDGWKEEPSPFSPDFNLAEACPTLAKRDQDGNAWVDKNCTYFTPISANSLYVDGADLGLFDGLKDWLFLSAFISLLAFNRLMLDINITSPHGFYRDRLSKAYLFRTNLDDAAEQNDNLKLQSLNAEGTVAPYHILNAALNLQGSKDPDLRGRMCDFFMFSKKYTGSDRTGYVSTHLLEKCDKHLNLGTAMAISGAAASPNMGVTTNRSLIFLLTLLNIRLGYWLPHPSAVKRASIYDRLRLSGAKPSLIWKEAMGSLDAKGSHINISDGGHLENLGIYPLLKRRCKFIVAIDVEADPNSVFNGLVTTMRLANIDMGVEIELNLEEIRKNIDTGLSTSHFSVGKINYGGGEVGYLLYLKSSLTGDEPEYIRAYKTKNPAYPHQSTADQFFSEEQFEAYRALGEHVLENCMSKKNSFTEFKHLFSNP
jgi:hypothetical protein